MTEMIASLSAALLLAAAPSGCPDAVTARTVYKDAAWSVDEAGLKTVSEVAAYVRGHPPAEVHLSTAYHYRGNVAVTAVADAFEKEGVLGLGVIITSMPRAGPSSVPSPPDGYMNVTIQVDCDGPDRDG